MRSWLFVPGSHGARIAKALDSAADAVIIDWEDGVAPADKAAARTTTAAALSALSSRRPWLRINAHGDWHADDLVAARELPLAGLVLPKAESPEFCTRLAAAGWPLLLLLETPLGVERAFDLACLPGVDWLGFGSLDYLAAIQGEYSVTGDTLNYARSRLINAARAAGLSGVVDGAFVEYRDIEGLRAEADLARRLGFDGKLLIHPGQIAPVHAALAPSASDRDWARRLLDAWEASGAGGVISLDGRMIDAPLVAAARTILLRAGEPR